MTSTPRRHEALPRVAVLVPSTDTTLEQELPLLLAGRATIHITRMRLTDVTPEGLAAMEDEARSGCSLLADIQPDVLLYGCTSGSFFRGANHEMKLAHDLATRVGAPVVTAAWAVSVALQRHGRNVRIRTPYTDELTEAEADYMSATGLTVTSANGLGLIKDSDIAAVPLERLLQHVQGVDHADSVLLSCTNLPTLGALPRLRRACDLPVVTSNGAVAEAVSAVLDGSLTPASPARRRAAPRSVRFRR